MGGLTPDRIAELYASGELVILAAARPLGFAILFTAFAWGHLNSGLLRIAFALVLALPVMAPLWVVSRSTLEGLPAPFVLLLIKEIFIGLIIGFLASLPFEALAMGGAIVDHVRGTGTPLPNPAGDATPFGQVFVVVALWLFGSLGGFWIVTDVIYASYQPWPMLQPLPVLSIDGISALLHFLNRLGRLALVVAGPLVILMLAVDLIFGVAGKLGKQLDVLHLAVSVKSLVALVCLPVTAMVLVRVITGEIKGLGALDTLIAAALR
jgi:type III secretion protein T